MTLTFEHALRILNNKSDIRISFEQIHRIQNRALPLNMTKYRLSSQLYKSYNGHIMNDDWMDLNFQQNFNAKSNWLSAALDFEDRRMCGIIQWGSE